MSAFRKNVDMFIEESGMTLHQVSKKANIPYSTLNSFLYSYQKDCKLSTAVKLAKAFGVSVDELVGCGTLLDEEIFSIETARNLSERSRYLICWLIEYEERMNTLGERRRTVNVMNVDIRHGIDWYPSYNFENVDISHLPNPLKPRVFVGIKMPNNSYMPTYAPGDILLIANDRPAGESEHVVVIFYGKIYIGKRVVEDGVAKLYSIRDVKFRAYESELDSVIGYVVDVIFAK